MFDKIVVGVDDREGGRDALALAAALAEITGGELTAVRVYPYETHAGRGSVGGYEEDLRADASAELEGALAETGVSARTKVIGDMSPARALQHLAEAEPADLLIVGSNHRGHLGRVLVGGVSAGVLHHAPCPVAVAPRGFADRRDDLRSIGVGFDGGDESQAALALATELARAAGATMRIVSAVATPVPAGYPGGYEDEWIERAEQPHRDAIRDAQRRVQALGVQAEGELTIGSAIDALLELTGEVDAIVVGSRGWGPVRRHLLGSTSERLVREASCAVIAVPRPSSND